jgi:excisionase family DNA binding protein
VKTSGPEHTNKFRRKVVYTTGDISRLFGVSSNTANNMVDRGVIPAWVIPGSTHRRVDHESLVKWLRDRPKYGVILARLEGAGANGEAEQK